MKYQESMENNEEKLSRQESLRLITEIVNNAAVSDIGRFNFFTIYGALGFVLSIVGHVQPAGLWCWLWLPVPLLSYALPYLVYRRRWKTRSVFGHITKKGFLWFAIVGVLIAWYANERNVDLLVPFMSVPLGCAMIMLSGLRHDDGMLTSAICLIGVALLAAFTDKTYFYGMGTGSTLLYVLFYGVCMMEGFSLGKRVKRDDE